MRRFSFISKMFSPAKTALPALGSFKPSSMRDAQFAGAGLAYDAERFSFPDLEADIVHGLNVRLPANAPAAST